MNDFSYLKRIEGYLANDLSEQERQQFEIDLRQNKSLKAEYDACVATEEALKITAFKGMMERIKKEETKPKLVFSYKQLLRIAASMVFLIVIGSLFFAYQNFSDEIIIDSNYGIARPVYSDLKGNLDDFGIREVQSAFQNKQYDILQNKPLDIGLAHPDYWEYQLILACTALKTGNSQKAIIIFKDLKNSNSIRKDRAQFLLVLANLQANKTIDAKEEINQILLNPRHEYLKEAQKLEETLNSFWRKLLIFE